MREWERTRLVCRSVSAKFTAFACASVYARVHKLVNAPRHLLKEAVGSWFPARPEVLTRSPNDPRRQRQSCSDPPCAFVFRPRSAPAAARLLARFWASPKSPGRGAVLPGAGREGRRSLAGTPARRPRGFVAEPAVPAMATTRRPQPPLLLRFATGQYASGKARDSGCAFLRAARVGKAGWGAGGGGWPARSWAEPWAEGALTLARQVGGGGADSAGGRWEAKVGAL